MDRDLIVQIIFYAFAAMTIGSAAVVVFARNLIRSAFALLFTFFGVAGLEDIYGTVWYIHAVLTGAFAACLPFSRMFHIVLAPVLLAVNAAGRRCGESDSY